MWDVWPGLYVSSAPSFTHKSSSRAAISILIALLPQNLCNNSLPSGTNSFHSHRAGGAEFRHNSIPSVSRSDPWRHHSLPTRLETCFKQISRVDQETKRQERHS